VKNERERLTDSNLKTIRAHVMPVSKLNCFCSMDQQTVQNEIIAYLKFKQNT